MREHRNPQARLAKRATKDNFGAEISDLIYLLRDNLGKADAFITAAEREVKESWRTDEIPLLKTSAVRASCGAAAASNTSSRPATGGPRSGLHVRGDRHPDRSCGASASGIRTTASTAD